MYIPYNKFSYEIFYDVLLECAFGSVLSNLNWVLFFDLEEGKSFKEIENLYLSKNVAFCFYLPDGDKFLFLIAYCKNSHKLDEFTETIKNNYLQDGRCILEKISKRNWDNFDFNNTILIGDFCSQQVVGELIDSLTGGLVVGVPDTWKCLIKNPQPRPSIFTNNEIFIKNYKKYLEWCDNNKKKRGEFHIEFFYGADKNKL